ncbi:hypothetical protein D3C83_151650 [compost metagenome]
MKTEKRLQVSLVAFIKSTDVKREHAHQEQEDDDKYVCYRCGEVGGELTFEDGLYVIHDACATPLSL